MRGRRREEAELRRVAPSGNVLLAFLMTHEPIVTECPLDPLRAEPVVLEVLGVEQLLTGLDEVPISLLQGESEVQLPEAREHDLQLGELAVFVQGGDVDIVW